jgi:hypothetical protein
MSLLTLLPHSTMPFLAFEILPLTKKFYAVYEVPADAKVLRFQARDLTSVFSPDYELTDLRFLNRMD